MNNLTELFTFARKAGVKSVTEKFGTQFRDTTPNGFVSIQLNPRSKKTREELKSLGGVTKDSGVSLSLFLIAPENISHTKSIDIKECYADAFVQVLVENGFLAETVSRLS